MTKQRSRRRRLWAAVGATFALILSACGTDSGSAESATNDGGLTKVVVGVQPVTPFANVPLGVEEGLFEKYGLDVEIRVISEATTIPPALIAGQLQFSDWSYASFALLADKGLPLRIVGPGDTAGADMSSDYTQLIALKDSGITDIKQLEGKKVATNALQSLSHIQTMVALDNAGVDPESVKYIPIPYPEQAAALEAGQVDAVQTGEPFLTKLGTDNDITRLAALDVAIMPNMPVSTWMTSEKYHEQHPDIVRAFQLGLRDSSRFAQENPDKVRKFVTKFTGVDDNIAKNMILPTWVDSVDPKVQKLVDIMHDYGATKKPIDIAPYLLEFPLPE